MTEITTDLDDLTTKDLTVQIVLRLDRDYERMFASAIEIEDANVRAKEAYKLISDYATALTDAGFPEIAAQVLKVVA